jgi:hypothetical protein
MLCFQDVPFKFVYGEIMTAGEDSKSKWEDTVYDT